MARFGRQGGIVVYRYTIDVQLDDSAPVTEVDRASQYIGQVVDAMRTNGFHIDAWDGTRLDTNSLA